MPSAKDLRIAPIAARDARAFIRRTHYSGKVSPNSQLHLGVFLEGRLEGAMQFGPPIDKRQLIGLVEGTLWNGFLELNRLAFSDRLPRNSESRAIAVALRLIRRAYPHIGWVVSFADAAQCGDGAIYRAAGFCLTGAKRNTTLWRLPSGEVIADVTVNTGRRREAGSSANANARLRAMGAAKLPGWQLRYIYFLDPTARERLTCPILPFSRIAELGAGMYRGEAIERAKKQARGSPPRLDGAIPIRPLQSEALP